MLFLDSDNHLNGGEALGIFPEGINYIGVFEVKSTGASASLGAYYECVRCDGRVYEWERYSARCFSLIGLTKSSFSKKE